MRHKIWFYGSLEKDLILLFHDESSDIVYMLRFTSFFPVPDVIIEGSPDIHAQSGSSVTLKCLFQNAIQEPNDISW